VRDRVRTAWPTPTAEPLPGRLASSLAVFSPGRRAVKPLLAVAAIVALIAGYLAWRSRPAPEPVAQAVTLASSATAPTSAGSAPMLVVAVQGRVRHPGLVRLAPGARVADAIAAAGGALAGTDLSLVNLAQKVADGQLIVIGKSGPAGGSSSAGPGGVGSGPIDLNTATVADLDTLPGIGPSLAQHIIDYRTAHGSFHSVDELRSVSGIGDAKFAEIKDLVTV